MLQSLQVSSGVRVLPERVAISTFVPEGTVARQRTCAPRGDRLRVTHVREVGASLSAIRGQPKHLAWVRRGKKGPAAAVGNERRHLFRIGSRHESWLIRIAGQPINLALVAGGDEHVALTVEGDVVRRVLARFPDEIRSPVRCDTEHGACSRTPRALGAFLTDCSTRTRRRSRSR